MSIVPFMSAEDVPGRRPLVNLIIYTSLFATRSQSTYYKNRNRKN